jgi:hypothetical protein
MVVRPHGAAVTRHRSILLLALLALGAAATPLGAQTFEFVPFGGYRFGGDLYEVYAGRSLALDGAPSYGVMLDLFVKPGASVSFLYSRQQPQVAIQDPWGVVSAPTLFAEHVHAGGTYEVDATRRVRPFLAGSLGLTRYGGPQGSEVRFSTAGGGGVRLMPSRHVGIRFDGRIYAVFVDGRFGPSACGGGACRIDVDVFVVWQVEFTAGLVIAF